jgi:hypothetical protein
MRNKRNLRSKKKITVAKLLVRQKRISSAPKLSKPEGELNLNLHVLARRSRNKKQQQLQMHEREREREREREKTKTMKGLAEKHAANAGVAHAAGNKTHCKTLVRSITIYTPDTSTYYLKHVLYTLYSTVYIFRYTVYTFEF